MSFKKEELLEGIKNLILPELSRLQSSVDQLEVRLINVESRLDQMDKRFDQMDKRIDDLRTDTTKGFDQVDKRFDQVSQRFNQVDRHILQLENAVAEVRQYVWTSGVYGRTEPVRQPMFVNEEPSPYLTKPTLAEQKPNSADEKNVFAK